MAEHFKFSKPCDPTTWFDPDAEEQILPGEVIFPSRSGTQFIAGPFATLEEARAAWVLLMMPAQGNA